MEASSNITDSCSPEEVEEAVSLWQTEIQNVDQAEPGTPRIPRKETRNVLVTSALPYVNNVPHLGNIIGSVLSADVFARYCRLRNYNTVYICGTDEYGTATETKALEEGLTPAEICEKYFKFHDETYKWFNIAFDKFGRTSTAKQTEIAQDIFWKVYKNGYCLEDTVEQLYCETCQRFLADRFVEGTCPTCAYEDARGDQCDKCGKLVNAPELKNPRCKVCKTSPIVKSSKHLFLDLPKLEPKLKTWFDAIPNDAWSQTARVIASSWLRDGLKPRCITRDLKWGTPVPLEGFQEKVFYVWFDAPIGYLSIAANYSDQWEQWFKNPKEVELHQFMAKDNVAFHGIIFPATLLATGDNYTIVNHLMAVEYLNYEDTKFSKSRGIGLFGNDVKETGIPADIWRFYLLYIRPESQDSSFNWNDLMTKNNSELLNNLGNFVNRGLSFLSTNFKGVIPKIDLTDDDKHLIALINREVKQYIALMEKARLRDAIRHILNISRLGNQHIQNFKPWVLVKGDEDEKLRSGSIMALTANISALISLLLKPYTPEISATLQKQLNISTSVLLVDGMQQYLKEGHQLGTKMEQKEIDNLKKKYAGDQGSCNVNKTDSETAVYTKYSEEQLSKMIDEQGNKIRAMKLSGSNKDVIQPEINILNAMKKQQSQLTGIPLEKPKKSRKK